MLEAVEFEKIHQSTNSEEILWMKNRILTHSVFDHNETNHFYTCLNSNHLGFSISPLGLSFFNVSLLLSGLRLFLSLLLGLSPYSVPYLCPLNTEPASFTPKFNTVKASDCIFSIPFVIHVLENQNLMFVTCVTGRSKLLVAAILTGGKKQKKRREGWLGLRSVLLWYHIDNGFSY